MNEDSNLGIINLLFIEFLQHQALTVPCDYVSVLQTNDSEDALKSSLNCSKHNELLMFFCFCLVLSLPPCDA